VWFKDAARFQNAIEGIWVEHPIADSFKMVQGVLADFKNREIDTVHIIRRCPAHNDWVCFLWRR